MQFDPSHNSAIINYYHTSYSTSCSNDPNYFATWQFLATFTHSIMILQLPLIIFTGYCILQKTPKEMGSLKWAMLNVHFWTTYMDVILCSLITPYIFFPALGGFSVGLLQVIGVPIAIQTFIGISSVGFMFSSIAALFENRSSSFERNRFRIQRSSTRFLFFLSNALIFNSLLIPVFLHLPDQNMAKLYWLENVLKCPTIEFFTSPVFIFILEKFWGYYTAVVLTFEFSFTIFTAVFFISCTWYYMFYSDTHIHSPNTKRLQRMFFIGNLIQIAVPSAFWVIPFLFIMLFYQFGFYNQSVINIGICFISLHGFASMIVVLAIHKPYRTFVIRILFRKRIEYSSKSNSVLI